MRLPDDQSSFLGTAAFALLFSPRVPAATQTETDEYTRYELLAPETASFKIYYEVTHYLYHDYAVVLPAGWYCTANAIPATVSQLPDGTVRLDYWDDRPEPVDVLLKARRRAAAR